MHMSISNLEDGTDTQSAHSFREDNQVIDCAVNADSDIIQTKLSPSHVFVPLHLFPSDLTGE